MRWRDYAVWFTMWAILGVLMHLICGCFMFTSMRGDGRRQLEAPYQATEPKQDLEMW